ncbi:hypothetical protein DFH94DRAFT_149719 [Russula ochroleuca]|jgi:hypothetical protein|uniref:Uncharacterized protein n=1 Tax=Russula ochroleuca TaxID=152965 RepID=A0A9P5MPX4_9AGAM|nr:hypothetical protein DFH94DRAFT_149719 [Russula ochroleuca]
MSDERDKRVVTVHAVLDEAAAAATTKFLFWALCTPLTLALLETQLELSDSCWSMRGRAVQRRLCRHHRSACNLTVLPPLRLHGSKNLVIRPAHTVTVICLLSFHPFVVPISFLVALITVRLRTAGAGASGLARPLRHMVRALWAFTLHPFELSVHLMPTFLIC